MTFMKSRSDVGVSDKHYANVMSLGLKTKSGESTTGWEAWR